MKKIKNPDRIAVCVVTNMYLDKDYIEEWCQWYYSLGFNYIYILEDVNGRTERFIDMPYIKEMVDNGMMEIEEIPHQNQWLTYPMFYNEHGDEFKWCGIFDSDEFLVLNKHFDVNDFLNDKELDFSDCDSIQICWRYFDDNGKLYKEDLPVMSRFLNYARYNDKKIETKIIVHGGLENMDFFIGHAVISGNRYDKIKFCNGSVIGYKNPFHLVNYDYAQLNHYYCKSTEEFINRKCIGRLDLPSMSYYDTLNFFKKGYFDKCQWTSEKEEMFNKRLEELK